MTKQGGDRILILDGDPSSRSVMQKRLQTLGFETDWVASVDEALIFMRKTKTMPHLVLVDIVRLDPKIMEFPKNLHELWPHLPVAINTAISDKATILKAIQCGFIDYMIRPMETEIFRDRIMKLIHRVDTLNATTFRKAIDAEATLEMPLQLSQINEFGLVARSFCRIDEDTIFKLSSPFFERLGLPSIRVRVAGVSQNTKQGYQLILAYVDLDAHQLTQIRRFALGIDRPFSARVS